MKYRELKRYLDRMMPYQLDQNAIVEVRDGFYNVVSLEVASGEGSVLYKNELFFTTDETPLSEKDFDEE